jgi:hypothetical protein
MANDNDAVMLQKLGDALTSLQVKYRASALADRMAMKPSLDELMSDYSTYQLKLLKEGIITTADDLRTMDDIKSAIDSAAKKEALAAAIAKTIGFIATKV